MIFGKKETNGHTFSDLCGPMRISRNNPFCGRSVKLRLLAKTCLGLSQNFVEELTFASGMIFFVLDG